MPALGPLRWGSGIDANGEWLEGAVCTWKELRVLPRGIDATFPRPASRSVPSDHLRTIVTAAVQALEGHLKLLRLLVAFAIQPADAGTRQIDAVVERVRQVALTRFALAAFDDSVVPQFEPSPLHWWRRALAGRGA